MAKTITTFTNHIVQPAIQVIIIALLTIAVLTFAFPAYTQNMSSNELQTKALMLNKQGQYSEAVKVAEEALKVTEVKFGSDHPEYCSFHEHTGFALFFTWQILKYRASLLASTEN